MMFLLAHAGITLGAAALAAAGAKTVHSARREGPQQSGDIGNTLSPASWLDALGKFLDIRLLIVGSLLPDIIDKPLGLLSVGDGRGYAHTLVFAVVLSLLGGYFYLLRRKTWGLALALGTIAHLVLDSMWLAPQTFLWPSHGWVLPAAVNHNWLPLWWTYLSTQAAIDAGEGIGLAILLFFAWVLLRRRKLMDFLRSGRF